MYIHYLGLAYIYVHRLERVNSCNCVIKIPIKADRETNKYRAFNSLKSFNEFETYLNIL